MAVDLLLKMLNGSKNYEDLPWAFINSSKFSLDTSLNFPKGPDMLTVSNLTALRKEKLGSLYTRFDFYKR